MTLAAPAVADTHVNDSPIDDLDAALDAAISDDIEDEEPEQAQPELQDDIADQPSDDGDAPDDDLDTEAETDADDPALIKTDETLEAPARWDAKGKALFEQANPEMREYIASREKFVQAEHTRRQQELAQVRLDLNEAKTAPDRELAQLLAVQKSRVSAYADVTDEVLLEALTTGRISSEQAQEIRANKHNEQAALEQLESAAAQREETSLNEHREREFLSLQATNPQLATREGLSAVNAYLNESGATAEDMKWMTAKAYIVADKARQFDALQAVKAKSKPAPVKQGKASTAKPANEGSSRSAKMAALRRKNTPEALSQLIDLQLDEQFDQLGM